MKQCYFLTQCYPVGVHSFVHAEVRVKNSVINNVTLLFCRVKMFLGIAYISLKVSAYERTHGRAY